MDNSSRVGITHRRRNFKKLCHCRYTSTCRPPDKAQCCETLHGPMVNLDVRLFIQRVPLRSHERGKRTRDGNGTE